MSTSDLVTPSHWSGSRHQVAVASAAHLAFQTAVTGVVYPRLARVPPSDWSAAHARHTRSITPYVAAVYLPLALSCLAETRRLLHRLPDGPLEPAAVRRAYDGRDAAMLLALTCAAGAAATTAVGPARTHSRLAEGHDPRLVRRLLRQDRVRWAWAATGAGAALLTVRSRLVA